MDFWPNCLRLNHSLFLSPHSTHDIKLHRSIHLLSARRSNPVHGFREARRILLKYVFFRQPGVNSLLTQIQSQINRGRERPGGSLNIHCIGRRVATGCAGIRSTSARISFRMTSCPTVFQVKLTIDAPNATLALDPFENSADERARLTAEAYFAVGTNGGSLSN